jgi:G3E family GTPase
MEGGAREKNTPSVFNKHPDHAPHHGFVTWHWTSERPLSLPKLRAAFELLPESVYRAKGLVYLEEVPEYRVLLQKVGKRSKLRDLGKWGEEPPRTEIVMIGTSGGIDQEAMRIALEGCVRQEHEEMNPVMRRIREVSASAS